jgi:hypothetical protein
MLDQSAIMSNIPEALTNGVMGINMFILLQFDAPAERVCTTRGDAN